MDTTVYSTIRINGEPVDVIGKPSWSMSVSDSWEFEVNDMRLALSDPDRIKYHEYRASNGGTVQFLDADGRVLATYRFSPKELEHERRYRQTKIRAFSIANLAKQAVISGDNWSRPAGVYTVREVGYGGDEAQSYLLFEDVGLGGGLFADDELTRTSLDPETGDPRTERLRIQAVFPEHNRVNLDRAPNDVPVIGDQWTRANNEDRYVRLKEAIAKLNRDLVDAGIPVTVYNETGDVQ